MKTEFLALFVVVAFTGIAQAEELRCVGLDCMKIPPTENAFLQLTAFQQVASQGVRCAGECGDGSDVHGTFRDPIAGVLGLTRMCRAKGGLKEGSVDCSD